MKFVCTVFVFICQVHLGFAQAGVRSCAKTIVAITDDPKSGIELDIDRETYVVKGALTESIKYKLEKIEDCHRTSSGLSGKFTLEVVQKNFYRNCYHHRKLFRWHCETDELKPQKKTRS